MQELPSNSWWRTHTNMYRTWKLSNSANSWRPIVVTFITDPNIVSRVNMCEDFDCLLLTWTPMHRSYASTTSDHTTTLAHTRAPMLLHSHINFCWKFPMLVQMAPDNASCQMQMWAGVCVGCSVCVCVRVCVCVWERERDIVCVRVRVRACVYVYVYVCICVGMSMCEWACLHLIERFEECFSHE